MFNESSALVLIWAKRVKEDEFTRDEVPMLSNLKDMVLKVLDGK